MQLSFIIYCAAATALVASCGESSPERPIVVSAAVSTPCGTGSYLTADLYGAIRSSLDWRSDLTCQGMQRPAGRGARLRLSGAATIGDGQQLALILGMPTLERGAIGEGFQTNVTLIAEDQGLFFSTTDTANCWTDIAEHAAIEAGGETYRISGVLYCVSPLPEVNGNKNVTLSDLKFASRLNWKKP